MRLSGSLLALERNLAEHLLTLSLFLYHNVQLIPTTLSEKHQVLAVSAMATACYAPPKATRHLGRAHPTPCIMHYSSLEHRLLVCSSVTQKAHSSAVITSHLMESCLTALAKSMEALPLKRYPPNPEGYHLRSRIRVAACRYMRPRAKKSVPKPG